MKRRYCSSFMWAGRPRALYISVGGLAVDHAQLAPLLHVAHHDERPVLRISGRGRSNGGVQNAGDDILRYWIGLEPAQRPCGVDRVEQCDVSHGEPSRIKSVRDSAGSIKPACAVPLRELDD